MNNKMRVGKLYAFILLIFYCISFIPSIVIHEHSNIHHHNELSHCESIAENLAQHTNCSHKQHLNDLKKDCFLCEHCIVYTHLFTVNERKPINTILLHKNYEVLGNLSFQKFISQSNKSPPKYISKI
jgi:hypothetical protein